MDSNRSSLRNAPLFNASYHRVGNLMEWASRSCPVNSKPDLNELRCHTYDYSRCISSDVMRAIEDCSVTDARSAERKKVASIFEFDTRNYIKTMVRNIYEKDDQKASLILQSKVKSSSPEQRQDILVALDDDIEKLMDHRFGNFLIQSVLETADPAEIIEFSVRFTGEMAKWSKYQFGCHVIQKLLDVCPLVVRAKIVAELLDDVVDTMTSGYGTHVWQKLIYLPWSDELPPLTVLINNAVHLKTDNVGWSVIAQNEYGGAIVKSYLGASLPAHDRQVCLTEIVKCIPQLIITPVGANLITKLLHNTTTRSTAINIIGANAGTYAKHPTASENLIQFLHFKIPSFPCRLLSALGPHVYELWNDKHARNVLKALGLEPGRPLIKKRKN